MGYKLTNELRDKILFENIALGLPPKDIAKKYGVTPQTITRQRDVFEKTKARDWGGLRTRCALAHLVLTFSSGRAIGRT